MTDGFDNHTNDRPLRRARFRKRGHAAMMKGVFFLPSLATLGNAICGFAAIYVTTLAANEIDPVAGRFGKANLMWAAYLVFFAAIFDVLDGRLARLTRHTTDFGGQLDSLADVISFGVAPAFVALQLFKTEAPASIPLPISRLVWAIGALYVACTAMRLARFNVTNEHGEQHHKSFQGLPSPAAGLAVLSLILLHVELVNHGVNWLANAVVYVVPAMLFTCALLMVSEIRYPHLMNTAFKGRKSIWKLVLALMVVLLLVVNHRYTISLACVFFVMIGPIYWLRVRKQIQASKQAQTLPTTPQPQ
jgi:CDP-diacylglycerol--serine O-phosphatidyltransferase